jgi:hypothetical protein
MIALVFCWSSEAPGTGICSDSGRFKTNVARLACFACPEQSSDPYRHLNLSLKMGSSYERLLSPAALVDDLALKFPDNIWLKVSAPRKQAPLAWEDVTWGQLRRAVHFTARWIARDLGPGTGDEPVAYTGKNDHRYPIVMMAALMVGYKVGTYGHNPCVFPCA